MLIKSKFSGWLSDGTRTPFLGKSGGGGGGSAPPPSSQTVTQTSIPEYARPYVETMLGKSAALTDINQNPYQAYGGQRIQGFNENQEKAFANVFGQTPASQLGTATNLAGQAGLGAIGMQGQAGQLGQEALGYGATGQMYGGMGAQQALQRAQQTARQAGMYGGMGANFGAQAAGMAPQAQQFGQQAADIGLGGLGYGAMGAGFGGRGVQAAEQGFGAGEQFARQITDPGATRAYMSPYMQNAVDFQKSEAIRDFNIGQQAQRARAVGSGAFGGSRQAIVESEALRNLGTQLGGIQATGTQKAFEDAQRQQQFGAQLGLQGLQAGYGGLGLGMQGAETGLRGLGTAMQGQQAGLQGLGQAGSLYGQGIQGAQAGLQGVGQQLAAGQLGLQGTAQGMQGAGYGLQGVQAATGAGQLGLQGLGQATQAASTLGQLGQTQFGQEQAISAEQQKVGAIQQAQAQQALDLAYQDFLKQRNYPYQQLAFQSDMLRGLPLSQSAQSMYTAPPSMGSQLGGLGMSALGIYGMSGGFKANGGMVGKGYAEGGKVGYATGGDIKMMKTEQLEQMLENPALTPLESDMVEKELMLRRRMEMNPESDQIMAGITAIPTGNMVPMEQMAGGGIVAFSKGNKVTDKFAEYEDMMMADIKRRQQAMEGTDPFAAAKAREAQIEARLAKSQETAPYRALAMAGLGTMAGTSQYGLTNAALGGIEGLKSYAGSQREVEDANKLLLQQAGEREKSQFARESALLGSQQTALGQMLGRRASAEATAASRAATAANQSNADAVRAQNSFNTLLSNARTELTKRSKPGGALYKKYKDNPNQLEMDAQEIARSSMSPELMSKLDIPKLKMPEDAAVTPPAKGAPAKGMPQKITTQDQYNKLKSGERYIDPNGQIRTKS
jgi:hypothetical protein